MKYHYGVAIGFLVTGLIAAVIVAMVDPLPKFKELPLFIAIAACEIPALWVSDRRYNPESPTPTNKEER